MLDLKWKSIEYFTEQISLYLGPYFLHSSSHSFSSGNNSNTWKKSEENWVDRRGAEGGEGGGFWMIVTWFREQLTWGGGGIFLSHLLPSGASGATLLRLKKFQVLFYYIDTYIWLIVEKVNIWNRSPRKSYQTTNKKSCQLIFIFTMCLQSMSRLTKNNR